MKWLRHITPMIIVAISLVCILIYYWLSNNAAEVKSDLSFIVLPVAGGCLLGDFIIKKSLYQKLLWIWITELILLLIVFYLWVIAE